MRNKFGKWGLTNPSSPEETESAGVYFSRGNGYCHIHTFGRAEKQPYRRLIASAPDLRELLIAALPALQEMQERTPEHLENLAGVAIVARVKAALAFIDRVEPESDKS
jgi:hypothetical protein